MLQLPVPPKFFPPVHLNEEDETHLRRLAKEKLRGMQDLLQGRYSQMMNWVPCEAKGQMSSLDGPQVMKTHFIDLENNSQRAHACMLYRSTIVVNASFSEVMNAIASSKTDEYRKQMRGLYGPDFVDGYCLHTLPQHKIQRPGYFYTALKWCVLQPPTKSRGLGSDFCFLEYAGIHKETEANEKMGFCIQQSVAMDSEVPDFAHYGLQRDTFQRTGLLVTATARENTLRLTAFCQIQNARLQPANPRDLEVLMYRRVAAIRDFSMYLERGRLGKMQFVERWRWIPDTDRRTCAVCLKMFLFRRKHHCRQCGEVVCNMCSPHREIDTQNVGLTRVRICTICMMRARSNQAITDDQCGSSVFTAAYEQSVVPHLPIDSSSSEDSDEDEGDYSKRHHESHLVLSQETYQRVKTPIVSTTASQRPVLEFDDDDGTESDLVPSMQPSRQNSMRLDISRRDQLISYEPRHPYDQSRAISKLTQPERQQQILMLPMPYPSSFNQPSDLESVYSFQTNATDDTDCPYAPQNYTALMQKVDTRMESMKSEATNGNLSKYSLLLDHTSNETKSFELQHQEPPTREKQTCETVIRNAQREPVTRDLKTATSTPTTTSSNLAPPTLTDSMKASLLARRALLQSRDRSSSFRNSKSPRTSKLRSMSQQETQLRVQQTIGEDQLVHEAAIAFARLNHPNPPRIVNPSLTQGRRPDAVKFK